MEKVSIIVPIYNAMPYLGQCIESVLAQTFTDFKLILIDDGSTDQSGQVCEQYKQKDERIYVYHQTNKGVGAARNKGIDLANGDYIMFIDPDDWIESNLLEEIYDKAEKEKVDLVLWSLTTMIYNPKGTLINKVAIQAEDQIWTSKEACQNHFITIAKWNDLLLGVPWNKFYRRDIIKAHHLRFPKLRRRQDIIFNIDYYKHINSLSTTSKVYSNYRVIDKGYEHKVSRDYADIAIYVYRHYKALFTSWEKYKNEEKQFLENYFLSDILRIMGYCMNPEWKWSFKERYRYISEIMRKKEVQQVAKQFEIKAKVKGLRAYSDRFKIKWLKKNRILLMLCMNYIEHFYQRIRYRQRVNKEMGDKK